MPEKISKESLMILEQGLTTTDHSLKNKYTLKQAIEKLFPTLKRLRELNLEWNEIALRIEELLEHKITINATTLQRYYGQIAKAKHKKRTQSDTQIKSKRNQGALASASGLNYLEVSSDQPSDRDGIRNAPVNEPIKSEVGISDRISDRTIPATEHSALKDEESTTEANLTELNLDDFAIANEELGAVPEAAISAELGLIEADKAPRQWVEPEFNHMRVTFSDD